MIDIFSIGYFVQSLLSGREFAIYIIGQIKPFIWIWSKLQNKKRASCETLSSS